MNYTDKDLYLHRYIESKVLSDCISSDEQLRPELFRFYNYIKRNGSVDHIVRYVETYKRMLFNNLICKDIYYCETGDLSCVSEYLVNNGYRLSSARGDFRYEVLFPTETIDVLMSLEVAEHIKDQDPKSFDDIVLFNYSGIRAYAAECFRILKKGGQLILTTPNACSLASILNALEYKPPLVYAPHVKEYAPSEVISIFEQSGFKTIKHDTFFSYFYLDDNSEAIASVFNNTYFSRENRGDTAFFIFRK